MTPICDPSVILSDPSGWTPLSVVFPKMSKPIFRCLSMMSTSSSKEARAPLIIPAMVPFKSTLY
uniref:Uncharacterized protein n=1 Tax=Knipowitschia caucasica TaxID=637954 RepID=A0AAV2K3K0_KNICA